MAVFTIRGGDQFETVTPDESRGIIRDVIREENAALRERYRGVKRMEVTIPVATPAISVFVGGPGAAGPEEGYIWSLMLAGITLSSGGNNLTIYKASASGDTRRPLAFIPAPSAGSVMLATWSKSQAYLRHAEGLYLVASGGTINTVYLAGEQVPSEMEGKLYD